MLRELELLPVWTLRQPLPELTQAPITAAVQETPDTSLEAAVAEMPEVSQMPEVSEVSEVTKVSEILNFPSEQTIADAVAAIAPAEIEPVEIAPAEIDLAVEAVESSRPLRALSNEDGTYLFFMQPALPDEAAETLLQNMLRAMRVICRIDIEGNVEHLFNQHSPKLVICFGEAAANQLTQQSMNMTQWRSHQPHYFQQLPLIVTFAPQHLLQHNQDKALAWRDLCLAMQLVQNL